MRVPLIVLWPGVTTPGRISETPVITMDLFPSLVEMCGLPGARKVDRVSLVPLLCETGVLSRDTLFWHYPHHQYYPLGGTMP